MPCEHFIKKILSLKIFILTPTNICTCMRIILMGISILLYTACFSQTTKITFDTARAMLNRGAVEEAIPYFQKVMAEGDEALKRTTINYLTTEWVNGKCPIAVSKSVSSYGKLLNDYMRATFAGKESTMNTADHYTAGLIFWAFAYSGALAELDRAIYQLETAARGGNSEAIFYLARVVNQKKKNNPEIQWLDVINLYTQASIALKTPQPLIELGNSSLNDVRWHYKKAADLDTAREVFITCLYNVMQTMPDSFHIAVNSFWESGFSRGNQDTAISNLIKTYFARVTVPSNSPVRKGLAWHHLYEYFYDNTPPNDTIRGKIMNKLKSYYNNDRELLAVIADFLNTSQPNEGFALSINSKWLSFFSPMQVSNPESFFSAVAKTEQDYLAFLEKNAPASRFINQIAQGSRKRLDILFDFIFRKKMDEKYWYALGYNASSISVRNIEKLSAFPDIRNSSAIKYVYADMAVLNNISFYLSTKGGIPIQFNELPNVYSNWSAADKKGYDIQYIKFLLEKVQQSVNLRISGNSLAEAAGQATLDLNDYDKAQKTINQISILFKTN